MKIVLDESNTSVVRHDRKLLQTSVISIRIYNDNMNQNHCFDRKNMDIHLSANGSLSN